MVTQDVMTKLNYKAYFTNAISYDNYKAAFQAEMEENSSAYAQYLPQNWSRQSRLDRKFKLNDELLNAVKKLTKRKNWLLITEHWCGDASQINPIINRIAEKSEGKINLRITYREANDELIDAHL